jgi:Phosphotransferase enzyme family
MGRPVPDLDPEVLDPTHMLGAMRTLAQGILETRATVQSVMVERLERRLLRYRVEFGGERPPWTVIGKVYGSEADGWRGFNGLRRLWDGGFPQEPPACVHIPRAYGYRADLRLLLMEEVPGKPLKKLVKRRLAGSEDVRLFASGLAKLHRSALVPGAPFGVDDHLEVRCAGLHESLAQAFPEIGGRIRWIVERARELELRHAPLLTAVHGDFHLGQVHVLDGELWILDLDPLHFGDPAYDVAMVFVMLKHLEHELNDPEYIRTLRDEFIAAYFSENGCAVAERVPLHVALIHLKRACKRFRYQDEPGWPETIRRQIEEAAECMEQMGAMAAPRCPSDVADMYTRCPATV